MKKILLSNIGNRNLLVNGEFVRADFLATTKTIYNTPLNKRPKLKLNIIDELLNHLKGEVEKPDKIVLFASAQYSGRTDQDTEYAAYLVKELIEKEYGISTEVVILKCTVVDHNQLIKTYKSKLKILIAENGEACHYLLNDSGGTAQQKSSLRVVLHFMLNEDELKLYQVTESIKAKSQVAEIEATEYRKVLQAESFESLVSKLHYDDSLLLMGSNMPRAMKSKSPLQKLTAIAQLVLTLQVEKSENVAKSLPQKEQFSGIRQIIESLNLLHNLNDLLNSKQQKELSIFLHKAHYYYCNNQNEGNDLIMALQQFAELYLPMVIENTMGYRLTNAGKYEKEIKRLDKELRLKYADLALKYENERLIARSLGGKIDVAKKIDNTTNTKFLKLLEHVVSDRSEKWETPGIKSLNGYRNDITHRAKVYSMKHIRNNWPIEFTPWIEAIFATFGLNEKGFFDQINEKLMINIRS